MEMMKKGAYFKQNRVSLSENETLNESLSKLE